ncbi:MAG: PAS domain S-box protein [Draconibacterium sp.]|nr:PAS domain S-box protein [Draconibacterium sp.]
MLESETRFKALHNASFGGIAIHDSGKILECNQGLAIMTGYSPEELIGMDGTVLFAENSYEIARSKMLNGDEKPYETIGKRKNGEEFPVRLEARNVPYKGKIVRTTEFRDITEQKQAEKSLKERDEIFRHFMENSPVYVFFKDTDIKAIQLSKNYENLLGLPLDQIIGKSMDELFPSDLAKKMIADDMKVLREGKLKVVDEEFNGRCYTTIKFPIIIDGKPAYLAGYTIDNTERRRAEETLKSSEERLKVLFNFAPEAYFMIDLTGVILDGNIASEKLLGYDKMELVGKSFFDLNILPEKDLLKAAKLLSNSEIGKSNGPEEYVLIKKDGSMVTAEITTYRVQMGGQTKILGIARDISERKSRKKKCKLHLITGTKRFRQCTTELRCLTQTRKLYK